MFVLFGSPRSGTTLLASTLNSHPRIIVPEETDFIIPAAFLIDRIHDAPVGRNLVAEMISHTQAFPTTVGRFLTKDQIVRTVEEAPYTSAGIVSAIYAEIARSRGAVIAGDKSPNDLRFVRILVKTRFFDDPSVRVLHLVRDPRGVVESLLRAKWGTEDPVQFARTWNESNLMLRHVCRSHSSYFPLTYEQLVADFDAVLDRICSFLEVPFDDAMLDFRLREKSYDVRAKSVHVADPVTTAYQQRWRELPGDVIQAVERSAAEGMREFGYAPSKRWWRF